VLLRPSGYGGGSVKVYVNTDGAVGPPNPGPAGAGYVILFDGEDGPRSVAGAVPLPECSHHEAEYHAAIHALRRASDLGATHAVLRSDSMVLVDQMNDVAEVRSPEIAKLADQLHREMEKYDEIEIVWVCRKENRTADLLSKVGLAKAEPAAEPEPSQPRLLEDPAPEILSTEVVGPQLGPEPEALAAG
jgi:ribonuclease HI